MTNLEMILSVALVIVVFVYISSKFKKNQSIDGLLTEIKGDFKYTFQNISEIIKNPIFDQLVDKIIKELIIMVEEKNSIARKMGTNLLTGTEKKYSVLTLLTEFVSSITGSSVTASDYITDNQKRIETIIDDYISFSNKMNQKENKE